jgi:hypothetical protein
LVLRSQSASANACKSLHPRYRGRRDETGGQNKAGERKTLSQIIKKPLSSDLNQKLELVIECEPVGSRPAITSNPKVAQRGAGNTAKSLPLPGYSQFATHAVSPRRRFAANPMELRDERKDFLAHFLKVTREDELPI